MIKRTAAAMGVALLMASGAAMACDQDEALAQWEQGEEHGIILGAGEVSGAMAFAVDDGVWAQLDYDTRRGMAETFECLIAGPGNVLRTAHVVDRGGQVLAVWDGVSQELEFR
jgi:hypothetical protein